MDISPEKVKIVVISPAFAVRMGLRALLESDESIDVISESPSVSTLGDLPSDTDLLVATTDAANAESWRQFLDGKPPGLAVLFVSEDPDAVQLARKLPVDAWGIVSPDASTEVFFAALEAIYQGLVVLSPEMMARLESPSKSEGETLEEIGEALTPREMEVLQLLAEGMANKQIAYALDISDHTVKFHISSIYRKFDVTNRTEAVRQGLKSGLIVL